MMRTLLYVFVTLLLLFASFIPVLWDWYLGHDGWNFAHGASCAMVIIWVAGVANDISGYRAEETGKEFILTTTQDQQQL